jgi:preprotein translocase subunit Sss1
MFEESPAEYKRGKARKDALALLAEMPWISVNASRGWKVFLLTLSLITLFLIYSLLSPQFEAPDSIYLAMWLLLLLIYESGQRLTMRFFGYKNLRISISGEESAGHERGTVFQVSWVLLMGWLPGVIIGCVCGAVYLLTQVQTWLSISQLFISFSAMNLLPLYPWDGGQFILGILPRRTYAVQWPLQMVLLAVITVIMFELRFSLILAVVVITLLSAPDLYRQSKICSKLLKRGLPLDTPGESIPPETAEIIVDTVQETYGKADGSKIADIGWSAWLRLKAKRPTRTETLTLLAVYGLTFVSVGIAYLIYLTTALAK